ncbi:MAG: metallophosphoesterase [Chloroflexota bacterium]
MPKTLVIGDIHGCYNEFQTLLDTVGPGADDKIIHIGDLMDRGPQPQETVEFFMNTPNAISLMGNRDEKHIRAYDGELDYDGSRGITRDYLFTHDNAYAAAIEWMRDMPLYIDLPEAYLVHGYYEPGVPLTEQQPNVLLGHLNGEFRLEKNGYTPWYAYYDGPKPIIMGHREYPFVHYNRTVFAIDTRCVYGGMLTGLLLPDFTLHSVPARRNHYEYYRTVYGTD